MENDSKQREPPFTKEERASIIEYANVLRFAHNQLVSEGYFLPCGKVWNVFRCASPIGEMEVDSED